MQSINKKALFIWGLAALFYLYELMLRVAPSVMMHELSESFGAGPATLGILIALYYYAYTLLQLPCGIILDRIGNKRLLGGSAFLCCLGTILFMLGDLTLARMGRFLIGAGSACAFISCLKVASDNFSTKHAILLTGATNMMGTIGGLLGGYPIARVVNAVGWQATMGGLAAVGAFLTILILVIFPSDKKEVSTRKTSVHVDVIALLKNKQVVLASIITSLLYLPMCSFAELWVVPYFMTKFGINNAKASLASATIYIGVSFGSILMTFLANHFKSYNKTLKIAALICAAMFIIVFYMPISFYLALSFMLLIGIMTGAQPLGFICAKNNAAGELAGTALAFTNCMVMLLGSVMQSLMGKLLEFNTSLGGKTFSSCDIYSYNRTLVIIPILLLLAFVISLFLRETYPEGEAE